MIFRSDHVTLLWLSCMTWFPLFWCTHFSLATFGPAYWLSCPRTWQGRYTSNTAFAILCLECSAPNIHFACLVQVPIQVSHRQGLPRQQLSRGRTLKCPTAQRPLGKWLLSNSASTVMPSESTHHLVFLHKI